MPDENAGNQPNLIASSAQVDGVEAAKDAIQNRIDQSNDAAGATGADPGDVIDGTAGGNTAGGRKRSPDVQFRETQRNEKEAARRRKAEQDALAAEQKANKAAADARAAEARAQAAERRAANAAGRSRRAFYSEAAGPESPYSYGAPGDEVLGPESPYIWGESGDESQGPTYPDSGAGPGVFGTGNVRYTTTGFEESAWHETASGGYKPDWQRAQEEAARKARMDEERAREDAWYESFGASRSDYEGGGSGDQGNWRGRWSRGSARKKVNSPNYKSRLQDRIDQAEQRQRIQFEYMDEVSASGKRITPGEFDNELRRRYVDAGVASEAESSAQIRSDFFASMPAAEKEIGALDRIGGATSIGFGAWASTMEEASALRPMLSGQAYLPSQVQTEASAALAPLLGSGIGGGLGFLLGGPGGAVAGSFAGQALGSLGSGMFDEWYAGRYGASAMTGQDLAYGRGGTKEVDRFAEALRSATNQVKDLGDWAENASKYAPVSTNALGNMAAIQDNLGTSFVETMSTAQSYIASQPGLAPINAQINATGNITPAMAANLSMYAAASGNADAMRAFQSIQVAATSKTYDYESPLNRFWETKFDWSPSFQRGAEKDINTWYQDPQAQGFLGKIETLFAGNDYSVQNKGQAGTTAALNASNQKTLDTVLGNQASLSNEGSTSAQAAAALQVLQLRGAGPDALAGGAQNVSLANAARVSTLSSQIGIWQTTLSRTKDPTEQAAIAAQIADLRQQIDEVQVQDAQNARMVAQARLGTSTAAIGEAAAGGELGFATGLYSGRSYAQLSGQENSILGSQARMSALLRRQAANKSAPWTPEERAQMRTHADEIDAQIAARSYDYHMSIYGQNVSEKDLAISQAQARVVQARDFGSPQDVFSAQGQLITAYTDKIAELNREISSGTLTLSDRIDKERQLAQTQQQLAQAQYDQQIQLTTSMMAISGYQASGASAQYGIDVRQHGSGAQSSADVSTQVAAYQADAERAQWQSDHASNPEDRAKYAAAAQEARSNAFMAQMQLGVFSQSPDEQASLIATQGSLGRLGRSFLEQGSTNDLRMSALSQIGKKIAEFESYIKTTFPNGVPDALKPEVEEQRQSLLDQRADLASQADTSYFDRLPGITIGGTSFMERWLPTPGQVASNLEGRGFGTLAARNFGFYKSSTYDAVENLPGSDWLTAGKSLAQTEPGNLSLEALGRMGGFAPGAHPGSPSQPTQVVLAPGSVIDLNVKYPDGTKQSQRVVVQSNNRASQTSSTSRVVPGVGR